MSNQHQALLLLEAKTEDISPLKSPLGSPAALKESKKSNFASFKPSNRRCKWAETSDSKTSTTSCYKPSPPKRKIGTWSQDEDESLVQLVEKFGAKHWSQITSFLPARTEMQIRQRWHNQLNPNIRKIQESHHEENLSLIEAYRIYASTKTKKNKKWTREEDELLAKLVATHGSKNWRQIAQSFPGRIGPQCYQRWHYFLSPALKKAQNEKNSGQIEKGKNSVKQEETQNNENEAKTGEKALEIKDKGLGMGFSEFNIAKVYERNNIKKRLWTPEEDQTLIRLVKELGPKRWSKIAEKLPGRNRQLCRQRWLDQLYPSITKQMQLQQGNPENCFNGEFPIVMKNSRKNPFTKEEDEILKEMVKHFGPRNWNEIAQFLPSRIGKQCYHRWDRYLNPDSNKSKENEEDEKFVEGNRVYLKKRSKRFTFWTKEEDQKLIQLVEKFGPQRWNMIAQYLPGRTGILCRQRWNGNLAAIVRGNSMDRLNYSEMKIEPVDQNESSDQNVFGNRPLTRHMSMENSMMEEFKETSNSIENTKGKKVQKANLTKILRPTTSSCKPQEHFKLPESEEIFFGREETSKKKNKRWTKEEDEILVNAVMQNGARKWGEIASLLPERNRVQCYHRWFENLNPDLKRERVALNMEEEFVEEEGSEEMKRVRKRWWTKDEDQVLTKMVEKHGPKNWNMIAAFLPGRTGLLCRQRWLENLSPKNQGNDEWTPEENYIVEEARKQLGNQWALIAKYFLPKRTGFEISTHWNTELRKARELSGVSSTSSSRSPSSKQELNEGQIKAINEKIKKTINSTKELNVVCKKEETPKFSGSFLRGRETENNKKS